MTFKHEYWKIVVVFLLYGVVFGSLNCFGVLFKPMLAEFGWSRAVTSGPFALSVVVSGVMALVAGKFTDRFGPRLVATTGGVFMGTGYIMMSQIHSIWELYIYYAVLPGIGMTSVFVSSMSLLMKSFNEKGRVAGIVSAGQGIGFAVVAPVTGALIESSGWRNAILFIGIAVLLTITGLSQFLNPNKGPISEQRRQTGPAGDYSLSQMIRTRTYWQLGLAFFLFTLVNQIVNGHLVNHATDLGMSVVAAATVFTVLGLVGAAGRPFIGFGADRFGNRTIFMVSAATMAVAFGILVIPSFAAIYIFAVIYGFMSGQNVLLPPMTTEYFGLKSVGSAMGAVLLLGSFGGGVGPVLAGSIFDATGSYALVFVICACLCSLAVVNLRLIKKPASDPVTIVKQASRPSD